MYLLPPIFAHLRLSNANRINNGNSAAYFSTIQLYLATPEGLIYPFVRFDYYRCHFCTYVSPRQNLQYPFSAHVRHGIELCMKNWLRWN